MKIKRDLKKYILIHLDEKWEDIKNINFDLYNEVVKFQKKPYIITAIISLLLVVGGTFYFLNNESSNDIEYTDNSKSVLESFRNDQDSLPNNNNASSNIVFVALMEFQNQSKILTGQEIENISKLFSEQLFE